MIEREKIIINSNSWPPSGGIGDCRQGGSEKLSLEISPARSLQRSGGASSPDPSEIRNAIRNKYTEIAVTSSGKFSYPVGKEGAGALGYDSAVIESADPGFLDSFCGVGNPFSLGKIRPGDRVLDFGCGAGFDLFVAAALAGESGRVYGVDLTEAMVERAKENLTRAGLVNFEVRKVDSEKIPYDDGFFDVVISNGVINLSPDKAACFREIHRVLKPGGRLQFADVVLEKELPAGTAGSLEAWSKWIGGTIPVGDQVRLVEAAGFIDVEFAGYTGFRTSESTVGALFRAVRK